MYNILKDYYDELLNSKELLTLLNSKIISKIDEFVETYNKQLVPLEDYFLSKNHELSYSILNTYFNTYIYSRISNLKYKDSLIG